MKTKVIKTKAMGRGVAANKDFKRGDIVEVSPCITWGHKSERQIQETDLKFYVFEGKKHSVLALGNGSLFNHKQKGNLTYTYDEVTNEMVFIAMKAIKKGQELFINYGYDPVSQYERHQKKMESKAPEFSKSKIVDPEGRVVPVDEHGRLKVAELSYESVGCPVEQLEPTTSDIVLPELAPTKFQANAYLAVAVIFALGALFVILRGLYYEY